jgi:phosphatidylcholine synthase
MVHVLTASGAALVLMALLAAADRQWSTMFIWLVAALVVDAIDGPLARRLKINVVWPDWSGEILDLVVDFGTYVLVPAFAIARSELLPQPLALPAGILIVVTGCLYFADRRMKTSDNYFRGFPAVWNIAAFYLFLLKPAPWISTAIVAGLAVLTFVPIPFVHPFRVTRMRVFTTLCLGLGMVLAGIALARDLSPGGWVTAGLCLVGLYFLSAGMLRLRAEAESDQ